MARGIEFDALGKHWQLRFDINALCAVEAELKRPFAALVDDLASGSILTQRAMMRAAMGGKVTAEKAGEIMEDLGIERSAELLGEAIGLAFPQNTDGEEDAASGN